MVIKKLYYLILFLVSVVFSPLFAQRASKGRIIEDVFILQNKQRELAETIQLLKKKLTDCFAQQKKLKQMDCSIKKADHKTVELSHCALYQKLFPVYIKELEVLAAQGAERINLFSQDEPVEDTELKKAIDRAFLIEEKLKLELSLIDQLVLADTLECEIKHEQAKNISRKQGLNLAQQKLLRIKRNNSAHKKKLKSRRNALAKLNEALYKAPAIKPERTFFDELAYYIE